MCARLQRDPNRTARPEVLSILRTLLARPGIKSAHYVGYAHEPVLRLLSERFGKELSVLDYWDRYGQGAAFLADEGCGPFPETPEWLEGVGFCVEGRPAADLLVWDMPWWGGVEQREALLWGKGRRAPDYVVLVDEGREATGHPAYRWFDTREYSVGVLVWEIAGPAARELLALGRSW